MGQAVMSPITSTALPASEEICLKEVQLDTPQMAQLVQADWPRLRSLDFFGNQLDIEAMHVLVQGNWPLLQGLGLAQPQLDNDSIHVLLSGKWPHLSTLFLDIECLNVTNAALLGIEANIEISKQIQAALSKQVSREDFNGLILPCTGLWPKLQRIYFHNEVKGQ